MNPDFVHLTDNIVIEIQSNKWHTEEENEERIKKFELEGYLCIPIWEKELENEQIILEKIAPFCSIN